MSKGERTVVHDGGQLFRVEHQLIDGRELPYEFVRRVGATTVLPIANINERPHVLAIHNTRTFYGSSLGLPGGNHDGGFEDPEDPAVAGLRELVEEAGYGYPDASEQNVSTFLLRAVSSTILYNRNFAIARDVEYIGGEEHNINEIVDPRPVPVDEYLDPIFAMRRGELYPEINLAFAKAGMEVGREQTTDWIVNGDRSPYADDVVASFEPWMLPVE